MAFGQFFTGSPTRVEQLSRFNPALQSALEPKLMQALQALGNPQALQEGFKPIADEARANFFQETVPGIAERFQSLAGNSLGSSGALQQQLYGAGANLEKGLASLASQYGNQREQNLMNLLQFGQLENIPLQGSEGSLPGFLRTLFDMLLRGGAGAALGGLTAGPGGALAGAGSGATNALFGSGFGK